MLPGLLDWNVTIFFLKCMAVVAFKTVLQRALNMMTLRPLLIEQVKEHIQ